jgi:DNA-binding transcriptional ArsR family regulator
VSDLSRGQPPGPDDRPTGTVVPDATGLKALAHPVRLRILGLLRLEGPATASGLADRLGLNSGATSYHLRHLERHGFVLEDAALGNGRDRWWRAAHGSTRTATTERTREEREATDAFGQAIALLHTEQLQRAVEERALLPEEWRAASILSDWQLRLTAARAQELTDALDRLVSTWDDDPADGDGTQPFTVIVHAFPRPGHVPPVDRGEEA